jgi:tight adherence protein B
VVVLAAGVLCWPAGVGGLRLLGLLRPAVRAPLGLTGRSWGIRSWGLLPVACAAGAGVLLAGLGGAVALAMVTGTVTSRWRAGRVHRAATTAATCLSDALGVLVSELRAGTHPAEAVQAAAETQADASPEIARTLASVAAAARLGGDVPAVLPGAGPEHLRPWLSRLADAWALADRYGIPLVELIDAVRSDTEHRVRFAAEVQARLAGPRASAAVLAGLPLLGLALGHAVGAAPWRVLSGTSVGQLLLVIGTGLACAGVLWSARLISGVVEGVSVQALASLLMAAALLAVPGPVGPRARLPRARESSPTPGDPLPARWFARDANAREQSLELAGGWELLAACLRAGMPVAVGVRAVAEGLGAPAGPALRRTAELLALGADPAQAWQPALECRSTARLARTAQRSGRSGAAFAESLTRLATEVRADARERSEARAQRAGVLIAAPLGLCFLPAFLAIGVVPVLIGLAAGLMQQW